MYNKRVISFLLALIMLLGTLANPVFANSSNSNRGDEVKYEIQEIDGKTYKAYKVSDLGLKNPEKLLTPKYRTRAAGDPMEDWVKVKLISNTVGLTLGNDFNFKVYVALKKDDTKIAEATINPTEENVENQYFYFIKTQDFDENNPDHEDSDKWYLLVENDFRYDVRLAVQTGGNFTSETVTLTVIQRAMPLYKAVWFTNNKEQIPTVKATYYDGKNRPHEVDLNTSDLDSNEYKSVSDEGGELYVSQNRVIVKDENKGTIPRNDFLVSDMKGAALWKLLIDQNGEKKTQGFVEDGATKYHFNITGDYKTPFVATMREELKVKFDPNGATFDQAVKTEQAIGHSMKIGETFGDLAAVTVPAKNQITNIPQKDNKDQEFVGWVKDEANKGLDFSNGQNADKLVNPNGYEVKDNVTFYAVYAPKAQGKVAIQYVDKDGNAIKDKYKVKGVDYPKFADGTLGKDVDAKSIPQPAFIGYERSGDIVVTGKKYDENGRDTVEVPYKKLDDIIPEDKASDDVKKTYTKVTFAADSTKGKLKLGDADGGAEKVYYVNPVEEKSIEDVRAKDNISAEGKKDVYKVDETTPWTFVPDEVSSLTTVITTVPVTVNANFVKEKGTVTYEYKYVNNTTITDPSKTNIPAVPTDATQYDVETEVAAETNVANDKKVTGKTVPVEKNGVKIGEWTFGGWQPTKLTIKKNSQTDKNEFTGTWTFTEAGKQQVTYEFASGTNGETLPTEVTNLLTKQAESKYVNDTVNAPTDIYNDVVISTGKKQGTWNFDGWYAGTIDATKKGQALKVTEQGPNKFIGVWTFAEKGKKNVTFEFAFYNSKGNKQIPNNAIGQFKPTLPLAQNNKYVGSDIELPKFEGDKDNVKVDKGDLQGTWKFDGWYKSTDTNFENKLTAADAKVSATDAENKLVGKWILKETETKKVTREFVIDSTIVGAGKDVPTNHPLPQGVVSQKPNTTTNYIGSKQTPGKDKFNSVYEEINGKKGDWTFVKWDKAELTVNEDESKNVFTGTWTWTEKLVRPVDPHNPIDPNTEVEVKFLKGEHGTLSGIALVSGKEENVTGRDELAYYVKKKATWAAMAAYIPTALADYGWSVANPSWKPVLPATDKAVEEATFTAQYVAKPTDRYITLTLDENYRGGRISDYDVYQNDLIEGYLYRPRRKGYVFEGWSYNSRRLDEVRPGDRIEYSTILYAIWSKQKPKDDEEVEPIDTREVGEHKAYMFGYTDGTVRPNGYITRAEAAALVTRLLGLDTFASAAEPAFTDTPSSWYNKAINAAVARGIMKGYPDKSFRPNAPITRAEFTQMISTIDNKPYGVAPFADVVGHWAERPIGSEYQAGRIKGYPDGTFRPNAFITRAEAVVILNKIFERNYDAMSAMNAKNKEYIKRFIDLAPSFWGFNDMVEATNTHLFKRRVKGRVEEDWVEVK